MSVLAARHICKLAAAIAGTAAVLILAPPASARDRTLQNACFPPETLRSLPSEELVAKGDHRFDAPLKTDVLPSSAPFTQTVPQAMRGSIRRVELPPGEKLIALTFDLCEQRGEVAGYDGGIFDTLRDANVRATLFFGGKWMQSHLARTEQLMSDPAFEIANHSEYHRNLRKLDGLELNREITAPVRTYKKIRDTLAATQCAAAAPEGIQSVPPSISLFRFPFGACNAASLNAVNDAGLLAIQWDVSSGDPDPHQTATEIVNTLARRVRPGSIIVAHANGRGWHTGEALPQIISKLRSQGYAFVTVSELLKRGKPVISETCYDSKPGDTDRYDHLGEVQATAGHAHDGSGGWLPSIFSGRAKNAPGKHEQDDAPVLPHPLSR